MQILVFYVLYVFYFVVVVVVVLHVLTQTHAQIHTHQARHQGFANGVEEDPLNMVYVVRISTQKLNHITFTERGGQ